ncbi:MAG: hypothetical protein UX24_C0016G0011 [Candidatus Giovannonibacteria bacterium GW2011_GWB1_45_9b]|uniref:Uncharacterized protein n=5 Tax=Candidatus Giovannoniibacteriota TaxID=1752738 RepID=A0A1F5X1M2_9BACT|nr:MAG: hypothetical protein UW05_C0038G0001 [Candidatus Giovannonibacteria bacterium GW2011_GWC2_43_8]KKU16231.1 MAG: hypothetical protein UX24_C0016G0011 [Candidatus Giovannonibacteria bacterium GW2011_GWB1_45_9b]OGF73536.1 MAG: hypothetical protein A2W57_03530 [Candidatus Giovannonibacteria bacterium RIFCSPHIGHO2_02_43_16]OGF81795.1 MAG: hypothetical protein A2W48_00250 [Candidatus Giovannonibacteria bacterium RIFCSPHIGHO2_12_44_12]OGF86039.1 MAG: hypothetical protein A2Z63_03185 [Candidatus
MDKIILPGKEVRENVENNQRLASQAPDGRFLKSWLNPPVLIGVSGTLLGFEFGLAIGVAVVAGLLAIVLAIVKGIE